MKFDYELAVVFSCGGYCCSWWLSLTSVKLQPFESGSCVSPGISKCNYWWTTVLLSGGPQDYRCILFYQTGHLLKIQTLVWQDKKSWITEVWWESPWYALTVSSPHPGQMITTPLLSNDTKTQREKISMTLGCRQITLVTFHLHFRFWLFSCCWLEQCARLLRCCIFILQIIKMYYWQRQSHMEEIHPVLWKWHSCATKQQHAIMFL